MGHPPNRYAAIPTILLIAMLLGGCAPSSTEQSTAKVPQPNDLASWMSDAPCGQLNLAPPFVNITGTLNFRPSSPAPVALHIAPNLTRDAADFVLENCAPIGTLQVEPGANFSLRGLPQGPYFLAARIPNNQTPPVMSFKVERSKKLRTTITWTQTVNGHFVVALAIESKENETT